MKEETEEITEMLEELRRLETALPSKISFQPETLQKAVPILAKSVPFLRDLRVRTAQLDALQIVKSSVREDLELVRRRMTKTDRWTNLLSLCMWTSELDKLDAPDESYSDEILTLKEPLLALHSHLQAVGVAEELKGLLIHDSSLKFEDLSDRASDISFEIHAKACESDFFDRDQYLERFHEMMHVIDPDTIAARELETGPTVVSQRIPAAVAANIARARKCYVFGLHEATIVFCRCILETALSNLLIKAELIDGPIELMSLISTAGRHKYLGDDDQLGVVAHNIRRRANGVLHSIESESSMDAAREVFTQTRRILEHIYG